MNKSIHPIQFVCVWLCLHCRKKNRERVLIYWECSSHKLILVLQWTFYAFSCSQKYYINSRCANTLMMVIVKVTINWKSIKSNNHVDHPLCGIQKKRANEKKTHTHIYTWRKRDDEHLRNNEEKCGQCSSSSKKRRKNPYVHSILYRIGRIQTRSYKNGHAHTEACLYHVPCSIIVIIIINTQ